MKKIALVISVSGTLLLLKSCANIGSPSGGTKDTTAPYVKTIVPENKTTNFTGTSISVDYSEFVDLSTVDKELAIVPHVEKYEIEKGTKSLKIKFKSKLEKNTTYQVFFGKGVKDVNEANVCKLKSLVFSTGPYLDSLSITGTTTYLPTNKPTNCFIGLYKSSDTLNISKHLPYYWLTSENGKFSFENIKEDNYEVYAFIDNNKNKLLDKKEAIAFLTSKVNPKLMKTVELKLSQQNLDTLKLISTTDTKDFYQIKYSKGINKCEVSDSQIFKIENEKILIFKGTEDSLTSTILVEDTLGTVIKTKLHIDNKAKPSKNKTFIKSINATAIPTEKYVFLTERKLSKIDHDSINISYDTKKLGKEDLKIVKDSIYFIIPQYKDSLKIQFKKGSFISLFNDTLSGINTIHKNFDETNYGLISGKIEFDGNIVLQLLKNNRVEYSTRNKVFEAKYMEAGEYTIKVIKDTDNNGYWTQGDHRIKKQAEDIFFNPKTILLKANWELKDLLIKVE